MDRLNLCCRALIWLGICAAGALTGCASQTKLREAELSQLTQQFAGRYDNREQVSAARAAGGRETEVLQLIIVPIYAPILSESAFYVHETALEDERRVISQRIVSFALSKDAAIVESTWLLKEPPRWRNGHLEPSLFKSLMLQDLSESEGCEMLWHKSATGFSGVTDAASCRGPSRSSESMVARHASAELTEQQLTLHEGLAGGAEEVYRFTRRN